MADLEKMEPVAHEAVAQPIEVVDMLPPAPGQSAGSTRVVSG